MATKDTLAKLAEKAPRAKTYLDSFKAARKKAKELPDDEQIEKELKAEIRGALYALVFAGVITQFERRVLFTYYTL